jgi:hypothetical protein
MVAATAKADRRRLTLGAGAAWVRTTIGPTAWAVLETLAERAEPDRDRTVSRCSARALAAELRLASDTVARALRRLGDAGLVKHEAGRTADGRFGSGRYVLTVPSNVFNLAPELQRPSRLEPVAKSRTRCSSGEQLALLV